MKRKPRKDFSSKGDIDMMRPIPLEKIGTVDDPCFGKFFDPAAEECGRCGDSELCAIAQAQKLHIKRASLESTQPFKDIVPLEINWLSILNASKKVLKKHGILRLPNLKEHVCKKLHIHESDFDKHFKILVTKKLWNKRIIYNGTTLKLKLK